MQHRTSHETTGRASTDRTIGLLTVLAVLAIVCSSIAAVPGVYAYNEYLGDGGNDQVKNDGSSIVGVGSGLASAGGAALAAGKYAGVTSIAVAGGVASTGGLGLAAIGASMVA